LPYYLERNLTNNIGFNWTFYGDTNSFEESVRGFSHALQHFPPQTPRSSVYFRHQHFLQYISGCIIIVIKAVEISTWITCVWFNFR